MLKKGGNAADALVGMSFCVGVVGMYHSGIGGGGFMLIRKGGKGGKDREEGGRYEVVDGREAAPEAAAEEMFSGNVGGSVKGGLARFAIFLPSRLPFHSDTEADLSCEGSTVPSPANFAPLNISTLPTASFPG